MERRGRRGVKPITIDLDRASVVHLLRTYLMAKRMFPTARIEVTVSGRGVGFHIKLYLKGRVMKWIDEHLKDDRKRRAFLKNLEDIFIRALLWDDPVRLSYALKKWVLNPDERHVDLCFDEKLGGKERPLPLDDIIGKERLDELLRLLRENRIGELEKQVLKLKEEVEKELSKYKKPIYIGCIAFNGDDILEKLEKVCAEISMRDPTFKWRTYPCFMPEWDWMLVVQSDSEKQAWKRIVWLKNNAYIETDGKKDYFLKDIETRLWVKERRAT